MKKIIRGKRYDTDNAEKVGEWENGYCGDLRSCSEVLYRKKSGEYFIYGTGGPLSKYASSCDGSVGKNGCIRPVSMVQAQQWVADHLEPRDYKRIFEPSNETAENTDDSAPVLLNESDLRFIREGAAKSGMSISNFIAWKCRN